MTGHKLGNFCYWCCAWAAQLISGLFHLNVSFSSWFYKICCQPSVRVYLSVIFISSYKYLAFSISIGSVMGFHLEHTNHLYNTCSSCNSFGSYSAWHLKSSFKLPLNAKSDRNLSFHFCILYLVDDSVLLWSPNLSTDLLHSCLLISEELVKVCAFSGQKYHAYWSRNLLKLL
jgi:hypothetical protein